MKSGLTVVAICLCISVVFAFQQYRSFKTELVATQDLVLGLLYYMEAHDGAMPPSREAFLASGVVEPLEGGAFRVVAPAETRYNSHPHGYPITDLDRYQIAWRDDLTALKPNEYSRLLDADGNVVELIRWPSSGDSGKVYTMMLYDQAVQLNPAIATAPSGAGA